MSIKTQKTEHAWNDFDNWRIPSRAITPDIAWKVFDGLLPFHQRIIESKRKDLLSLLDKWDRLLVHCGRDPTYTNWESFRPLRLSREEDWSDWLAFLFEGSTTGSFAKTLLNLPGFEETDYALPIEVLREDSHETCRADLIIQWRGNGTHSHIEVKIGDPCLDKTFDTSQQLMTDYPTTDEKWTNHILLLQEQLPDWDFVQAHSKSSIRVTPITWDDVCIAIRKALRSDENVTWKSWAYAFVGAIEQILVGFHGHHLVNKQNAFRSIDYSSIDRKLTILAEGLNNEQ